MLRWFQNYRGAAVALTAVVGVTLISLSPALAQDPPPAGPDYDGDGVVGFGDFLIWASLPEAGDLDGNGQVGVEDFDLFFGGPVFGTTVDPNQPPPPPPGDPTDPNQPPPLPGPDYDGTGAVDFGDFILWASLPEAGDLNGDGVIDTLDFDLFFGDSFFGTDPNQPPPSDPTDPNQPPPSGIGPDFDFNGLVDFSDFFAWAGLPEAGDLDGNGEVGVEDFDLFYGVPVFNTQFDPANPPPGFIPGGQPPEFIFGDFDGNGILDDADVAFWVAEPEASDLDGDGDIDRDDFDIFFSQPPPGPDGQGFWVFGVITFVDPATGEFEVTQEDGTVQLIGTVPETEYRRILPGTEPPPVDPTEPIPPPAFEPASFGDVQLDTPVNVFVVEHEGGGLSADIIEFFEQLEPGFGGPDEPVILSQVLRDLLEEMRVRLEGEPPGFLLSIEEFRSRLSDDRDIELLELLGGSNGQFVLDDVFRALDGIFDFGPPPPGDFPDELVSVLHDILATLEEPGAPPTTPAVSWFGFLTDDLRALLEDIAGDDGEINLDEVRAALFGGQPPPPFGDLPQELLDVLFDIEATLLEDGAPPTSPASAWFGFLTDDLRGILEDIAGDDGEIDLEEVRIALGGGSPPPPFGDLPQELLDVLFDIEATLLESGAGPTTPAIAWFGFLTDDLRGILEDIAGDDGEINLDEVRIALGGGPPPPPFGDLPQELIDVLFDIEATLLEPGAPPPTPAISWFGFLTDDLRGILEDIAGDDGEINLDEVRIALGGGSPPPPFGDLPQKLIDVLFDIEATLLEPGAPPPTPAISWFGFLTDDLRGILEDIAGDDGEINLDEVRIALGGGPPPDGFPPGIPPEFEGIVFEIIESIRRAIDDSGGFGVPLDELLLFQLPEDLKQLFRNQVGPDGFITFDGLDRILQPGPGGPGDLGELAVEGEVVTIDRDAGTFDVQDETGVVHTVQVTDETEFFIRVGGPPPPEDGFGTFGQTQQGQFDDPFFGGDPFGDPFAGGGDPFEGFAVYEDLIEGDFVEVFGEVESDGTIFATGVKILRDFDAGGGGFGGFPVAFGRVIEIDRAVGSFVIDDFGFRTTVHVSDATVFEIQIFQEPFFQRDALKEARRKVAAKRAQFGEPGDFNGDGIFDDADFDAWFNSPEAHDANGDGIVDFFDFEILFGLVPIFQEPEIVQGTFDDLVEGDDVDIFGLFRDDGSIDADRVMIFRGPEQEEPQIIGAVVDVDADNRLIFVEGDDEVPVEVAITDDTVVGVVFFNPFQDDFFDPFFGGPEGPRSSVPSRSRTARQPNRLPR